MGKVYKVYSLTNNIDGKKYIGLTCLKLSSRLNRGYKENTKIAKAINKYGKSNFSTMVLFETTNKEEAEEKEQKYINLYDTQNNGYNICGGGYTNMENLDQSKKVRCIELNKVFNSCKEAQIALNIKSKHIGDACKGNRKKCGNYHWEFVKEVII